MFILQIETGSPLGKAALLDGSSSTPQGSARYSRCRSADYADLSSICISCPRGLLSLAVKVSPSRSTSQISDHHWYLWACLQREIANSW